MILRKTIEIPGVNIRSSKLTNTSFISLTVHENSKPMKYALDFIHEVPKDENELVDVETILIDTNLYVLEKIGKKLAMFFDIPFRYNVDFDLNDENNIENCFLYKDINTTFINEAINFKISNVRTIPCIYPFLSFEAEILFLGKILYVNFDVNKCDGKTFDVEDFSICGGTKEFWAYTKPIDDETLDVEKDCVYLSEKVGKEILSSMCSIWNANPYYKKVWGWFSKNEW